MNWWNDFSDWSTSNDGWRVVSGAIVPFVAIVVAGVIAALIGRGATKRVVAMQEREARNAAVAGIVSAARKAATWGSLTHDERSYADHLAEDADIRLRLLPVAGAPVAANWAQHQIADIKKQSSTFSFQAEQSLSEFRDRMLEWQTRPARARRLFKADLERWKFDSPDSDAELIKRQQQWNADQAESTGTAHESRATISASGTTDTAAAASEAVVAGSGAPARPTLPESLGTATARFPIARDEPATAGSEPEPKPEPTAPSTTAEPGIARPAAEPFRPPLAVPTTRGQEPAKTDEAAAAEDQQANAGELTHPKVDAAGPTSSTTSTSIPTRMTDAPAEPADPNETNEAPYAAPLSASELRRRALDDED